MCGIFAAIGINLDADYIQSLSNKLCHRGQDERNSTVTPNGHVLCHEKLVITKSHSGIQPFRGCKNSYIISNGDIYNHEALKEEHLSKHNFFTNSDFEVIIHLYEEFGINFLILLDGVFSFVIIDGDDFLAARDPLGVKPLFTGKDDQQKRYFSSEKKALLLCCESIYEIPAGHFYTKTRCERYYSPVWLSKPFLQAVNVENISTVLNNAVRKRVSLETPMGILFEDNIHSVLLSYLLAKELKTNGKILHSFSIINNESERERLEELSKIIGTYHHNITFSPTDAFNALENIIWHLEKWDLNVVKSSICLYFASKSIAKAGIKVLLGSTGYREIADIETSKDSSSLITGKFFNSVALSCLITDRMTMAHGIEMRPAFLDKEFIEVIMNMKRQRGDLENTLEHILSVQDDGIHLMNILQRKSCDKLENTMINNIFKKTKINFTEEYTKYYTTSSECSNINKEEFYCRQIFNKLFHKI